MKNDNLLPAKTPIVPLGKKSYAITTKDGRLVVREVTAVPDMKDTTKIAGFGTVYQGAYLSGPPEELMTWFRQVLVHAEKLGA